jgi:cytochrome c1
MVLQRNILALVVAGTLAGFAGANTAKAAEAEVPPPVKWSFAGPFGKYDRGQLQRGLKIYREVCASCHGLNLLAFRNLAEPGGPEFTQAQAKAIAADYKVKDGPNDQGEMFERPGTLADRFPPPFPNEQAARAANGGAAPPDLSVIAKARTYERGFPWFVLDMIVPYQEQGPDYIHALLKGYENPPQGFALPEGSFYNKYFPGHAIKMPPPLADGQVTYSDDSPTTVDQYAKDISAFLMWAAEPHLEDRKRIGFQVLIFLIIFAGLLYFTKKKVWREVELHPEELRPRAPVEYPKT